MIYVRAICVLSEAEDKKACCKQLYMCAFRKGWRKNLL